MNSSTLLILPTPTHKLWQMFYTQKQNARNSIQQVNFIVYGSIKSQIQPDEFLTLFYILNIMSLLRCFMPKVIENRKSFANYFKLESTFIIYDINLHGFIKSLVQIAE